MKRLMFWISWSMLTVSAVGQVPPTEWTRTYGGPGNDDANCIRHAPNDGFVIGGYTTSWGAGLADMWLLRISEQGDSVWSQTFGGAAEEYGYGLATAGDGFLLAGCTSSFGAGGWDFWLVRTDVSGNEQWSRAYGGSGDERCYAILPSGSGGYLLGGEGISVLKVNSGGDSLWALVLDGTVNTLAPTSDGNYVAAGFQGSPWPGDGRFWLFKFTDAGEVLWSQVYSQNCGDQCVEVQERAEGGFALFGYSRIACGPEEYWIIVVDADGNYIDTHSYGGSSYDYCYAGFQATDGGYVLAGYTWSYGAGERDMWIVKTDASGDMLWSQTYGGLQVEYCLDAIELPGREYVFVGFTQSFGSGLHDVYVVRTGPDDSILPVELLSFEAIPGDGEIELHWSTASESDLEYFEIVRDGLAIARVPAMNHATGHRYNWTDAGIANGVMYSYELVVTDISGEQEILAMASATPHASNEPVASYQLHQNYPNPFNPSTTIRYELREEAMVHLIIYNTSGQKITTLVNTVEAAGTHAIVWDGRDAAGEAVAAGLYFSMLSTESFTQTRKMILLK